MNSVSDKNNNISIAVAGTMDLDIVPVFKWQETRPLSEIVVPGHVIENSKLTVNAGGCVSNTGLGLVKLGMDVRLMGKAGRDAFGDILVDLLAEHASTEHIIRSEDSLTSTSLVLTFPGHDRIFVYASNSEDSFTLDDLDFDKISKCTLFHFGYPNNFKYLCSNKGEKCIEMFKRVNRFDTVTSLDMSMVDTKAPDQPDWESMVRGLMPYVDMFEPSIEEISYFIDNQGYDKLLQSTKDSGKDITEVVTQEYIHGLAQKLISWGAGIVLIKCGAKGIYMLCSDEERMKGISSKLGRDMTGWSNVSHFEQAYKPDKFCAATGAGDISIAGFIAAIVRGYGWERCMQLAAATGAMCVTTYDTTSAVCRLEEIDAKIERGWEKL